MPPSYDLLIHNATVLTLEASCPVIRDGMVAVRDGVIAHVGPRPAAEPLPEAVETRDAAGGIVMPGLVNTHTHLPMTLFRGLADDLPLHTWLNEHMFPAESVHMTPEAARHCAALACAELLLSGTTTCCDGYFHEGQVAAAVVESGLRAVAAQGVIDFPAPGVSDPQDNLHAAADFIDRWQGASERLSPSIFCHSPYTCGRSTLQGAKSLAREKGVLFQIHTAETEKERREMEAARGLSPVRYLDELGLLDKDTLLVHTIWVDERDLEIIAARGAAVSVTTESEMKLASGVAPLEDFLRAGIRVGLGTDGGASNNDLDMFAELDFTAKLHKVIQRDPAAMAAGTVLGLGTIGGAAAIGLADRIGSLAAGKAADVIVIDTSTPRLVPLYDPVSHVVYAVNGGDVRDVWVAGRAVVKNRRLLTLDVPETISRVRRMAAKLGGRSTR